jgi:hypothetical protein
MLVPRCITSLGTYYRCCEMAEKLLTGASFKAPDWKGPRIATAAIAHLPSASATATSATAEHALDVEMLDVEGDAAATASGAGPDECTPVPAAARDLTVAAAPMADAAAPIAAPYVTAAPVLSVPALQRDQQQQSAEPAHLPQHLPAPPAARRPMTVIRQPGWRPPPPQQQCPQHPPPPQPQPPHEPLLPLPPPQPLTHVNELPDDLLQHIFSMLPFRKRYPIAVVLSARSECQALPSRPGSSVLADTADECLHTRRPTSIMTC